MSHFLDLLLFLPLFGAICIVFLPRSMQRYSEWLGFGFSSLAALLGFYVCCSFDPNHVPLQFEVNLEWMVNLGVRYHLGIDGTNILFVLLTLFLTPLILLCNKNLSLDSVQSKNISILILLMETGALGTFLAQDIFLFYVFWEMILIPAYLLIGIYGSGEKQKIALQFFVYTFVGSLLMLIGILALLSQQKLQTGEASAAISDLVRLRLDYDNLTSLQSLIFWALAAGFFVKVPLFPFHGWLYSTYKNAPIVVTMYLSAILSKMGAYGVIKILMPICPEAMQVYSEILIWFAVLGLIYGAMLAFVQTDLKSLLIYASLSHVNGILLGIFALNAAGMSGAVFQVVSHAFIGFGMFLVVGILEKKFASCEFAKLGGLVKATPWLGICFFIVALGLISLPGTNGFVGEFFILYGAFASDPIAGSLSVFVVLITAAYMLRAFEWIMFGPLKANFEKITDICLSEKIVFALLICLIVGSGLYPKILLNPVESTITKAVSTFVAK